MARRRRVLVGGNYIIVPAHDRSSPSDPVDKWGNLKSAKKRRRRRSRSRSKQYGVVLGKY